jgi:hypothetical protein
MPKTGPLYFLAYLFSKKVISKLQSIIINRNNNFGKKSDQGKPYVSEKKRDPVFLRKRKTFSLILIAFFKIAINNH